MGFEVWEVEYGPSVDAVVNSSTDATPVREIYPWFARTLRPGQGPRMSLGPGAICIFVSCLSPSILTPNPPPPHKHQITSKSERKESKIEK